MPDGDAGRYDRGRSNERPQLGYWEQVALLESLSRLYGLPRDEAEAVAEDVARDQVIRFFGYGSLIWRPHHPVDRMRIASLDGYRRGFICEDCAYRGSKRRPGLTLGIDHRTDLPNVEARVQGAVLEVGRAEAGRPCFRRS